MSPRAAWRLEQLGFSRVYDYSPGEADWLAAGLPTEGGGPRPARAIDELVSVPTCSLGAPASEALAHAAESELGICVVVNHENVVAGVVRRVDHNNGVTRSAAEVMRPGPSTIRANEELEAVRGRMAARNVAALLVTTPEGVVLGALRGKAAASADTGTSR